MKKEKRHDRRLAKKMKIRSKKKLRRKITIIIKKLKGRKNMWQEKSG